IARVGGGLETTGKMFRNVPCREADPHPKASPRRILGRPGSRQIRVHAVNQSRSRTRPWQFGQSVGECRKPQPKGWSVENRSPQDVGSRQRIRPAILGISAFYHAPAAGVVVDGRVVAAAKEERFTGKKHASDSPANAVAYCLEEAGLSAA